MAEKEEARLGADARFKKKQQAAEDAKKVWAERAAAELPTRVKTRRSASKTPP
jgi:hypothetical protein